MLLLLLLKRGVRNPSLTRLLDRFRLQHRSHRRKFGACASHLGRLYGIMFSDYNTGRMGNACRIGNNAAGIRLRWRWQAWDHGRGASTE